MKTPDLAQVDESAAQLGSYQRPVGCIAPVLSGFWIFFEERVLQEFSHIAGEIGASQRVGDIRGEEADFRTAVEAFAFELKTIKWLRSFQRDHGIGQLNFAADS